ncbi:MAG: hypothetical protein H8E38_02805 [SAR324 cluster bacterium]|nr:hypothetical protein [SAR324 cluster bacterium]MBL7035845.1 hypothetical protein [SAR324 cluster bacterium]
MSIRFYIFLMIMLACISLVCGIIYKIYLVQQPFLVEDVPEWTVRELSPQIWELRSVTSPERSTNAWITRPEKMQCDTLIIVGGVEEGKSLLTGGGKWKYTGNTILMKQPVHSFLLRNPWKEWSILDWWSIPEKIREETRHTLGALNALLNYVHGGIRPDSRFTDKVVLAGGSVGSAFPVIITSFEPKKVAGLMIIYGFTNFQQVIQPALYKQGLIHFKLTEQTDEFLLKFKLAGIRITSQILSFVLANILKYGELEQYLPDIYETPIHFINGRNDPLVPTEAYLPMWNNSPDPKSEKWVEGGHFNPNDPADMLKIGRLMYEWAADNHIRSCYSQ